MKKIGMIVAMSKELKSYFETLGDLIELNEQAYDVWKATAYDKELYIVKSGVGEISAAAATQYLLTKFNVDLVINFGVCGKLSSDLKLLDTVVVKSVVHYQFDTSEIDGTAPGVYMNNSPYISADNRLIDQLLSLDNTIKTAVCASGDLFVSRKEDKEMLIKNFGADICEMESAGILITCLKNDVPCILIKSVSDDCDDMDFVTYCELATKKYVEIVDKFVKSI
ncbi:MAG: 5'-methylthioadenosine/S-adenosylhomocysteine nucleosidase [Clostridia bacterium]|nr:5'-methylthioadenosine/S-adenosylhomocysteine nucleosidase [Clostridia bacterium]